MCQCDTCKAGRLKDQNCWKMFVLSLSAEIRFRRSLGKLDNYQASKNTVCKVRIGELAKKTRKCDTMLIYF